MDRLCSQVCVQHGGSEAGRSGLCALRQLAQRCLPRLPGIRLSAYCLGYLRRIFLAYLNLLPSAGQVYL